MMGPYIRAAKEAERRYCGATKAAGPEILVCVRRKGHTGLHREIEFGGYGWT